MTSYLVANMNEEDDEKYIIGLDLTEVDLFRRTFQIKLEKNIIDCTVLAYWWKKNKICSYKYTEGKILDYSKSTYTIFPKYSYYKIIYEDDIIQWVPEYFIISVGNYIT